MVYTEEFLEELPDNFEDCGLALIERAMLFLDPVGTRGISDDDDRKNLVEIHAVINTFLEARGSDMRIPAIVDDVNINFGNIMQACVEFKHVWRGRKEKDFHTIVGDRTSAIFKKSFSYEFTDGDFSQIQTLVNELRDLIGNSTLFVAEHQRRLLRRLERLQSELHKKMSDLDHFWGLVGDAGVAIGKFGKDAKPFVDRFKEIVEIIWRTQARAEQLPSGLEQPLLEKRKPEG